jgi:hypothetical protein
MTDAAQQMCLALDGAVAGYVCDGGITLILFSQNVEIDVQDTISIASQRVTESLYMNLSTVRSRKRPDSFYVRIFTMDDRQEVIAHLAEQPIGRIVDRRGPSCVVQRGSDSTDNHKIFDVILPTGGEA